MTAYDAWTLAALWTMPIVTVAGFLFIREQMRSDRMSLETQTSWQIYTVSTGILQTLVSQPECRPYFYDGMPMPTEEPLRSRVLAMAELICDHMENIVLHRRAMDASTFKVWADYMQGLYRRSPVMQDFLKVEREGYRYAEEFLALVTQSRGPGA